MRIAAVSDRLLPAVAIRLLSAFLFANMAACIKLAEARGATLGEVMFFRQFGAACLLVPLVLAGPGLRSVRTARMPAHLLRTTVGLVSMAFTFLALMTLPLAEATTISFTVPIFATILGALVLRESTGPVRWLAVAVGFVGAVVVIQPGDGHIPILGGAAGLVAACLVAVVSILLRQIGRTESATTTVFWFSTLSLVPLGLVYAFVWQEHPPLVWLLLLGQGVLGGAGQLAMTASLRRAPVSVVVPIDYSSLLWATLYGFVLFGVLPSEGTWIGAPLIIGSGLLIVWREHRRSRSASATPATAAADAQSSG